MYGIALVVMAGYGLLFFVSRREDAKEDVSALLRPVCRAALYLYKKLCLRIPGMFASAWVEQDLPRLYPGTAGEILKREYYVKKLALCLIILLLGTLFGVGVKLNADSGVLLGENGAIIRGSYGEGSREVKLTADYGEHQMDFQVQVEPRVLSAEAAEELFDAFAEILPGCILGNNKDLHTVSMDLALEEAYGDYPISVEWESSRFDLLDSQGHVFLPEREEEVELSAYLKHGVYERKIQILVKLVPPEYTDEEWMYMEMEELLARSLACSVEQEQWILPSEWRGEEISWEQKVEDNSLLIWAGGFGTAGLVYLLMDRDLHEQLEKRKKKLRREYPEIVHRLVLFVGAGMTIRGAFQKIAGDYEAKYKAGKKESPACEAILFACRELRSGISEAAAYEHFGRRTGLQEYVRLSTLLMQNLKRGNSTLLERLREEADKAAQEQLRQGRKLGEEAGTKLLAPMVLMLAVVMVIIMIPAFAAM